MKPETGAFLEKAREFLAKAQTFLDAGPWTDEAGRAAYLAGFHAAQGLLFEKSDRVFKTHKGVQSEFLRLIKDEPSFDVEVRAFLGQAYNLKAIADYETGPGARVSDERASAALRTARHFVASVTSLLP